MVTRPAAITTSTGSGRRATPAANCPNQRPSERFGLAGLIRCPNFASSAGSSVTAASMSTATTAVAARPMLRRNGAEYTTSPTRLTATVSPEKKTVRPAAETVWRTQSAMSGVPTRSCLNRVTISSA